MNAFCHIFENFKRIITGKVSRGFGQLIIFNIFMLIFVLIITLEHSKLLVQSLLRPAQTLY